MPEKDARDVTRETMTITSNDVATFTPPPDERTDREKEIDDRLQVIEGDIGKLREEQKALVRERDEIFTKREATKKILAMSPAERRALGIPEPQMVENAGGIASGEVIGDVGAPAQQ